MYIMTIEMFKGEDGKIHGKLQGRGTMSKDMVMLLPSLAGRSVGTVCNKSMDDVKVDKAFGFQSKLAELMLDGFWKTVSNGDADED